MTTDMLKPENRTNLANLTPADGRNPLYGIKVLEIGAAWDMPGVKKSRFTRFAEGAMRSVSNLANESDADLVTTFNVGTKPVKLLGLDTTDAFKNDPQGGAGSAVATPDNLTGEGEGDDETHTYKLDEIPARITRIVITCGAFKKGADVRKIKNMIVTVYDSSDGTKTPVAFVEPTLLRPKRMLSIAVLERDSQGWTLRVVDSSFEFRAGDTDDFLMVAARC